MGRQLSAFISYNPLAIFLVFFQVTEIAFDFSTDDCDDLLSDQDQQVLIQDTIGQIFEADDEDDLIEEVTCASGWCIQSINYRHILR
jgi:hypothetical protein